jgi:hypothetical protein
MRKYFEKKFEMAKVIKEKLLVDLVLHKTCLDSDTFFKWTDFLEKENEVLVKSCKVPKVMKMGEIPDTKGATCFAMYQDKIYGARENKIDTFTKEKDIQRLILLSRKLIRLNVFYIYVTDTEIIFFNDRCIRIQTHQGKFICEMNHGLGVYELRSIIGLNVENELIRFVVRIDANLIFYTLSRHSIGHFQWKWLCHSYCGNVSMICRNSKYIYTSKALDTDIFVYDFTGKFARKFECLKFFGSADVNDQYFVGVSTNTIYIYDLTFKFLVSHDFNKENIRIKKFYLDKRHNTDYCTIYVECNERDNIQIYNLAVQ